MSGSAISLPFRFNEFGEVNYSVDPRKIWQDRVYVAIMTQVGERVMRPGYGTTISTALFENISTASEIITTAVSTAFSKHLKDLELIQVQPVFEDDNSGVLEINVVYTLPSGEDDTVTLKTAILSRSGDIIQEITNG